MLKFLKVLSIIVNAFVFSVIATLVLQYAESTQIEWFTSTTTITISNETTFGSPCKAFVKKGYFDSVGEVYVYMFSQYADYWNTFNVWMSLDNFSWTIVPFLESTTDNRTQMADLGLIDLGNPQLTVYQKYYVPPQTMFLPPNVTEQDASNLRSDVLVKRQATPADTTQWILVFFTMFGVIFSVTVVILDHFYSGKGSKRGKRTSRVKAEKRKNIRLLGFLEPDRQSITVNLRAGYDAS